LAQSRSRRYVTTTSISVTISAQCTYTTVTVVVDRLKCKPQEMYRRCVVVLIRVLVSLWLVQSQSCSVRVGHYDVLRNTSVGPIVCAMDQPQLVRNDARSHLHCSATCVNNDKCSSFNYKNLGSTSTGFICEHFFRRLSVKLYRGCHLPTLCRMLHVIAP